MTRASAPDPSAGGTGAILLAGGRASRMGGVAKPLLEVGGRSLLRRAVDAVRGCAPVTVVAEVLDPGLEVDWVREHPPFSGPAAAVAAALARWEARGVVPQQTFVFACDLPHPDAAVAALRTAAIPAEADGACLVDDDGRPQWLAGLYRVGALRLAAASLPDAGRDAPVRALLAELTIVRVPADADAVRDIDTWQDLEQARTRAGELEES